MGRIPTLTESGKVARRLLLAIAAAVTLFAVLPALASAATVAVNTDQDNAASLTECLGVAGDCSIRQALDKAAANDTVSIPAGHYTLDEAKGVLTVTQDLTIEGTGNPVIDGGGKVQVLSIGNGQAFPTVSVIGLTVTGGFDNKGGDGGGIVLWGTLNLTRSTVTGNKAATGGGIAFRFNEGFAPTARIVSSTISGNTADTSNDFSPSGGGIFVTFAGSLTMINSTVSGNTAGPGTTIGGQGGGIWTSDSAATRLYNTTVVDNTASGTNAVGGNLFRQGGGALLRGGGPPPYLYKNTIVGNGTAPDGSNCGGDNPVSQGNNLVSDSQCASVPASGDLSGDPGVAALGDYGGPTFTRKLIAGSKAINAGASGGCTDDNDAAITVDQRGVPRPQAGRCDIGSVEFAPPLAVTGQPNSVTTSSATITGDVTNPHVSAGVAHFEFGTSTAYGTTIDLGSVASGASHDPRSSGVTGLSPNTLYHYRIVTSNADDTSFGEDVTFITPVAFTPGGQPEPQPQPGSRPRKPTVRASRAESGCVNTRFSARISVHVFSSAKLRRVDVMLDGKRVRRTTKRRFSIRIDARSLSTGSHILRVTATDSTGRKTSLRRVFRRCARKAQPAFTG